MKNKRVVVTGGAGFIGSHLSEELARENMVTIIDDVSSGKRENIADLFSKDNVQFVQASITDLGILQEALRGADFVFHQAARPSVPESIEDPLTSHQVNVTGTLNVLIAARDNKVQKVICASSCAIYGDDPVLPKKEDMLPDPKSPYAVNKLTGEYYCRIFEQIYGLSTVCLRYFNVYGPRQDPNSQYAAVIAKLIEMIAAHRPPVIFGDGNQNRDFVFVTDVVAANITASLSEATGIFNIGTGNNTTVNNLAGTIMEIMGASLEPVYQDPRPGDVKHSLADITKAGGFGYNPRYSLEEGLKNTITSMLRNH